MGSNKYMIQFGGLPVGSHIFEMEITDKFFEDLENSEVQRANVNAEIELVKQNNVLTLNFHLEGAVELACDRCGVERPLPIDIRETVVVKHGNPEESTDEIVVLPHGETEVDVSHYLYEFIVLALPIKRVPCEEDDTIECDYEALEKLSQIETEEERENRSEEINPMWEKLKNIKINEN
jgi:uncharacterized protein